MSEERIILKAQTNSNAFWLPIFLIPITIAAILLDVWQAALPIDIIFLLVVLFSYKIIRLEDSILVYEKPLIKMQKTIEKCDKLEFIYFPMTYGNTHSMIFQYENKKFRFSIYPKDKDLELYKKFICELNRTGTLIEFDKNADSKFYQKLMEDLKVEKHRKILPKTL